MHTLYYYARSHHARDRCRGEEAHTVCLRGIDHSVDERPPSANRVEVIIRPLKVNLCSVCKQARETQSTVVHLLVLQQTSTPYMTEENNASGYRYVTADTVSGLYHQQRTVNVPSTYRQCTAPSTTQ